MYAQRVFCQDWPAAISFYRDLLGMPVRFADEAMGWAEFDLGGVSLAVERSTDEALCGRFVGISLQVEDIRATYEEMVDKGVVFTAPPEAQPWGGVLAHFRDPADNILTLLGEPAGT